MSSVIDDLLASCWPDGIPPRLDALVDRAVCAARLANFKAEPVLPFESTSRPVRLVVSAEGEGWELERIGYKGPVKARKWHSLINATTNQ